MRINRQEIEIAYRAVKLEELRNYFEEIERRIIAVVNVDSFKGAGARAMKAYLKETYAMFAKAFIIVIMETESNMKKFLNNLYRIDQSEETILDAGYLQQIGGIVSDYENNIGEMNELFETEVFRAKKVMELSNETLKEVRGQLGLGIEKSAKLVKDTIEQMYYFNKQELEKVEELKSQLVILKRVLDNIDGVIVGGVENFNRGRFANSPLGKELLNNMMKSSARMVANGDKKVAIGALSIVGGFLSTLSPELRELFESVKGRAVWCAFSGDPVNMATGNFIYENVDIKVEGRYPIIFNRFYNSLDDTNNTLGRNWTHNYNIKLSPIEDYGITVIYGDSCQEFYSYPDEVDINEENATDEYKAEASNFNVLKRLRNKKKIISFELATTDGSKYIFNNTGQLTKQLDPAGNEITFSYDQDQLIKIESPAGYLELTYEGEYIEKITDQAGRAISYEFENDLLSTYTNPLGNSYSHEYDIRQRLVKISNPEGNLIVENVFDEEDRVNKQTFADSSEMLYRYNDWKKLAEFTKQNGSKVFYRRDEKYRTTGIIEADGEVKIEYNKKSQRSKYIDKQGNETSFEYKHNNLTQITNPLGEVTELDYNDNNKLTRVLVNGAVKLENKYDSEDNLVSIEDALKRQIRFAYDKETNELPTHVVQPDGSVVKIKCDNRRNVTEVTDAFGVTTYYEYNSSNLVTKIIDGNGNETKFNYDANNNLICVVNADGNNQTFTYNKANKVTSRTDFDGSTTTMSYNSLNKPSEVIDPLGRVTRFGYDKLWNTSNIVQANEAETNLIYDTNSRLIRIEKVDGNIIQYEYDSNGNKTKIIDEDGNETHLTYDKLKRLIGVENDEGIQLICTYTDGKITKITDAMDNTTQFMYNEAGELLQEINPAGESRTYTYTKLGKIATVTDEAHRVTTYEYELGGRLKSILHPNQTTESFTYDGNGNIKIHIDALNQKTTYVYDSLNRVVEIINADNSSRKYTYNQVGDVLSMTDELNNTTNYAYTLTGQLEKVIDPLGNETHYKYNELDQLMEVKQLGGIDGTDGIDVDLDQVNQLNEATRITTYERNLLGQVTSVTDALGQTEHYKYSPTSQLIEKIDKDGFVTKYGYTSQGDMNYTQYADGKEVHMKYNPLRQLTEVKDWLGTTTWELDPLGRPLSITNHRNEQVKYTYGSSGERTSVTYPDGKQVCYSFDDFLRLTKVNDGQQEINYAYDELNRLTSKQFGDNTRTEYQYNDLGQLNELTHLNNNIIVDNYKYSYDALGNKTQINKQRNDVESDSGIFGYNYDELNRLQSVTKDGRPLRSYNYDNFGNRTSMIEDGKQTTYQFNCLNQLITSVDSGGLTQRYNYDKRGNCTEIYKGEDVINQYMFGALNRLETTFNHERSLGSTYDYNGLGNRVSQTQGTIIEPALPTAGLENMTLKPIRQLDDTLDLTRGFNNLLQRKENGKKDISYLYDFGVLSANFEGHNFNYLTDDLGTPARLIAGNGAELDVYGYDEYGNSVTDHAPKVFNPFGFTGYLIDPIATTSHAQAREYKPDVGRFVSQDMVKGFVELPQSFNSYAYCWNQPIDFIDLDGLFLSRAANAVTNVASNVVSNVADGIGNAVDAAGQWVSDNRDAIITGVMVVGAAAAVVATGGLAAPFVVGGAKVLGGAFAAGAVVGAGANVLEQGINNGWDNIAISEVVKSGLSSGLQSAMVATGWKAPVIIGTNMVIAGGEHLLTNDEVTLEGLALDMAWAGGFAWLGTRPSRGWLSTTIGPGGVPDGFVIEGLRGGARLVLPNTFWRELGGAFGDDAIQLLVENGTRLWNWLRDVSGFGDTECALSD